MKMNMFMASKIVCLLLISTKAIYSQDIVGTQTISNGDKIRSMQLQYPEELNTARASRIQKNYDDAIRSYELTIEMFPNTVYAPIAYSEIGDCYKFQDQNTKAAEFYNKAIPMFEDLLTRTDATTTDLQQALEGLSIIYSRLKEWDKVAHYVNRLVEPEMMVNVGTSRSGMYFMSLADAYYEQEKWEDAVSAYQKAIDQFTKAGGPLSNISSAHSKLTKCYKKLQDWKAVIKELQIQIDIGEKYLKDRSDASESRRKIIAQGIQTAHMEIEEMRKMQGSYILSVTVGVGIVIVIVFLSLLLMKKASCRVH